MSAEVPDGTEALRINRPDQVSELNDWVHDGYLEGGLYLSAGSGRVVIPFVQESAWGNLHPSMPDPELVKTTLFARHFHVPFTRCYIVVEQAESLESNIDWGNPMLLEAEQVDSTFRLKDGSNSAVVSVQVAALDLRLLIRQRSANGSTGRC